ncbi:MAG: TonB-dependent receptor [Pseudomonadota bacterium]
MSSLSPVRQITFSLVFLVSVFGASPAAAEVIDEVTIVGDRETVAEIAGSAYVIDADELARFAYSDIQRIARQIPGVSIQIEDGYGLRPNISIRGVASERSSRITLLEDNVLIAPAPYSAPSAYYFPTLGRIHAVEVVKGPSAITQGPYTIGGALNMVSTPIPTDSQGRLVAEAGEDATYRLLASYGATNDAGFGFLVETHQWFSDGFQSIDRSGEDTGLDVRDYTVKLSYAPTDSAHSVELKLQLVEQTSNQSYLGLTDFDFGVDATRRYGLSELDEIDTEHEQAILRYAFQPSDNLRITATAYNNTHERDWFKTEGIDFDGSASAEEFSRTSWANVIFAVNTGDSLGGLSAAELNNILNGTADTLPGSIQLRSNAREYYSRGVQVGIDYAADIGSTTHDLSFGIRYHEDEEDRLQRNSTFQQVNGSLVLTDLGLLGNAGNRIQEAEALSFFVQDTIQFGDWTLTPGIRYEDIDQSRVRYETRFGQTTDPSLRTANNFRDTRSNQTDVWLPGLGVIYSLTDNVNLIGGVHKGFSAPTNADGVSEEEAWNYEAGVRFQNGVSSIDAVLFLTDYDNLLGVCTASSGVDCEIGDAFNGNAATVQGLEFNATTTLGTIGELRFPLLVTYTYTDGEFDSDIADTDFFGDVSEGDPIPYIPEHQLFVQTGIEATRWSGFVSASYVDEVCTIAACGPFQSTDDSLTFDVIGSYIVSDQLTFYGRVENLTDEEDILGRQPYGARPNRSRTGSVGVRYDF